MINIGNDWDDVLKDEFQKEYYLKLTKVLEEKYKNEKVYPKKEDIFNAFKYTSFENTKVVILGQDPYIKENEAHGLSFSVQDGVKVPPSLKNIFKEIEDDLHTTLNKSNGNLTNWAKQGVLLLNSTLTVTEKQSNSHKGLGWEQFTDNVIKSLNNRKKPVVFLLWGNYAKAKQSLITNEQHLVLTAKHPSPLARGAFFGCKHFSKTNDFLKSTNQKTIDWHN